MREDLPYRKRLATQYRLSSKKILLQNIQLCTVLMRILARLQAARNKGEKPDRDAQKRIYMERIEDVEGEEEVLQNRLYIRKYLRELLSKQEASPAEE